MCSNCDASQLVDRPTCTTEENDMLVFHRGRIASGNAVVQDGERRDQIRERCGGALCLEMEAAGVDVGGRCLVIRGISDYSDSHKNDVWRSYAAGNAAIFARELLSKVPPGTVAGMETISESAPFVVPFARNQYFSGRSDAFRQLEMYWSRHVPQRVSIHGLGGCGKSALAVEFAYRIRERHPDCAVFWVPALTQQTFEQAYLEIGHVLKIPQILNSQTDKVDVKQLVKERLEDDKSGPWLMVVDNADDSHVLLDCLQNTQPVEKRLIGYLPQRKGFILLTTRTRKTAFKLAGNHLIPLEELSQEEAPEFLGKRLTKSIFPDDQTVVQRFLEMLAYLPLAIVQAVAFVMENNISLQRYIDLFNEARASSVCLLRKQFTDETRYLNANNAVATTWHISFDRIRQDDRLAADCLTFMACLRRENIPLLILPSASTVLMAEAMGTLRTYAFVSERVQQNGQGTTVVEAYDIHRLVHLATQEWMQDCGEWDSRVYEVLKRLVDVIPYGDHETSKTWVHYLEHGLHVAGLANQHDSMDLKRISLLARISRCQNILGQYRAAEVTQREVLVFRIRTSGKESLGTQTSMSHLGQMLRHQGKYTEAEKIHREELALRHKVSGREHPHTLTSMSSLGQVLSRQGKYAEAEQMHRETLISREKVLGREHRRILNSIDKLRRLLSHQGKYEEAGNVKGI